MRKDIDGFDIEAFDLDDLLMQNGMIDEFMYLQNVRNRRLFLNGEIKEKNVGDVVRNIWIASLSNGDILRDCSVS